MNNYWLDKKKVKEMKIYIELKLQEALKGFLFQPNTIATQLKIKEKINQVLKKELNEYTP